MPSEQEDCKNVLVPLIQLAGSGAHLPDTLGVATQVFTASPRVTLPVAFAQKECSPEYPHWEVDSASGEVVLLEGLLSVSLPLAVLRSAAVGCIATHHLLKGDVSCFWRAGQKGSNRGLIKAFLLISL